MGQGLSTEVGERALYYENIRDLEGVEERVLANEADLTVLDLSNKYLGLEGAVRLGEAVGANTSVTELNVSYNGLTPEAFAVLCQSLSRSTSIEKIIFAGNPINDSSMVSVAALLRSNSILHSLSLYNCSLQDDVMVPLVNSLARNSSLCSLDLSMNGDLTETTSYLLLRCLEYNRSLASIGLRLTQVSEPKMNEIQENLKKHNLEQEKLEDARCQRKEAESKKREKELEEHKKKEDKRREDVKKVEELKEDMELREKELQEEETELKLQQIQDTQARKEAKEGERSRKQQYVETAVSNAYTWRAKLTCTSCRGWESGFTTKPTGSTGDHNADLYGMVRTLQPCWCEPTDAPAGYAGQLHYHCKYEREPDTFHTGEEEVRKYEGCKRTGHSCISVGVYAKPLQKDTAATFFSSRSPHLTD